MKRILTFFVMFTLLFCSVAYSTGSNASPAKKIDSWYGWTHPLSFTTLYNIITWSDHHTLGHRYVKYAKEKFPKEVAKIEKEENQAYRQEITNLFFSRWHKYTEQDCSGFVSSIYLSRRLGLMYDETRLANDYASILFWQIVDNYMDNDDVENIEKEAQEYFEMKFDFVIKERNVNVNEIYQKVRIEDLDFNNILSCKQFHEKARKRSLKKVNRLLGR